MILVLFSALALQITSANQVMSTQSNHSSLYQPQNSKTLELRYTADLDTDTREVTVNGKTYPVFTDKQSAVDFYYFIKRDAAQEVIYYVISTDTKDKEVFQFRIVE